MRPIFALLMCAVGIPLIVSAVCLYLGPSHQEWLSEHRQMITWACIAAGAIAATWISVHDETRRF